MLLLILYTERIRLKINIFKYFHLSLDFCIIIVYNILWNKIKGDL